MCWCGPQLVVAHKREVGNANAELRLFCWEKGNRGFLPTPAVIPIADSFEHELTNVHVDLQEIILFMGDLEYEENSFYIYNQSCIRCSTFGYVSHNLDRGASRESI